MVKKYTATIELSLDVPNEKVEKITLEHLENKIDEYTRNLAEYQGAINIRVSNFYKEEINETFNNFNWVRRLKRKTSS